MARLPRFSTFFLLASLVMAAVVIAQSADPKAKPRRVPPPKTFSPELTELFAPDARKLLDGPRPNFGGPGMVASSAATTGPASVPMSETPAASGTAAGWAAMISADTLADELKSYQALLNPPLKTASAFKGGGAEQCRRHFSMLATTLGIIAQYDGDVRFKDQGAGARDLFARTGFNCKTQSDSTYKEAKVRQIDLESLLRGERLETKEAEPTVPWPQVADRPPLMRRLEQAQRERIQGWTADKRAFEQNAASILHEAEIVAVLGKIINAEGYEFADDSTYQGYANELMQSGVNLAAAVKEKNYEKANAAVGMMSQACDKCHGDFN